MVLTSRDGTLPAGTGAAETIRIDFTAPPAVPALRDLLADVDVVVNAVGIFREHGSQRFDAVHVKAPMALFEAAVAAGARRIVQVSALGADPGSAHGYFASKGRADAALAALPVSSAILRPSLVYAPAGASTRWFARLAALPLTPLPGGGGQRIQPVHLDDVCEAALRLVEHHQTTGIVDAVGAQALSLREYLALLKRGMGVGGRFVAVPQRLARAAARVASRSSSRAVLTPEALQMLERGSTGDPARLSALLGRRPRGAADFLAGRDGTVLRRTARLSWLVPLMRHAVAAMWLATAWVSLAVYPRQSSLELLARTGLHGAAASVALYGAAILDAAAGAAPLLLEGTRRRPAYRLQLGLILFYTLAITACLPEYWAHPYGPVLKNLPLLAMILALHELDDDAWTS